MVQQVSTRTLEEERRPTTCSHHWIIEIATGPTSAGVCQRCHEMREFKNYLGQEPSSKDIPAAQSGDKYAEMATAGDGD